MFRVSGLLGGSWDLVSKVVSTLIGVISNISTIAYKNLVAKCHEFSSRVWGGIPTRGFHGLMHRTAAMQEACEVKCCTKAMTGPCTARTPFLLH